MANDTQKTNDSRSQTDLSARRQEEKDIDGVDPLPNIKFTKRKMRIDHVKSKNKRSES